MDVGRSIVKAINEIEAGDLDSAMLHACNAVDGTAAKALPGLARNNNLRFTRFLRDNYVALGFLGMPGINLAKTRFAVNVKKPTSDDGFPDLADLIYGIHRCSHGHGDALPDGFDLVVSCHEPGSPISFSCERGSVRLSDRIIFGLLGVAILAPENVGQTAPPTYYFTVLGGQEFPIQDWWGRRLDFETVVSHFPMPSVTMNFGDWMEQARH